MEEEEEEEEEDVKENGAPARDLTLGLVERCIAQYGLVKGFRCNCDLSTALEKESIKAKPGVNILTADLVIAIRRHLARPIDAVQV
jgi:hypothetical protein